VVIEAFDSLRVVHFHVEVNYDCVHAGEGTINVVMEGQSTYVHS
jgi:hypothetical protein